MRKIVLGIALAAGLVSCSEYNKVMKSTDPEYKLLKAVEYYDAEEYVKAYALFDELLTLYRGTAKAEEIYFYYAYTNYGMSDYLVAAHHFKTFEKTFAHSEKVQEAAYMSGYCHYLESPVYSLDQTSTYKAIEELQLFANKYPDSKFIDDCNRLMIELRGKLERKAFEVSRQYLTTEAFGPAINSFNVTLDDFPDTKYREEIKYLLVEAHYELATKSVIEKQAERLKDTVTAYYNFVNNYPESKWKGKADKMLQKTKELQKQLKSNP